MAKKVVRRSCCIEVLHGERAEQVRLNGIDCPEMGQAFGRRAKQFTSQLAFGKEVLVKVGGYDRYNRTLGEVTLPDGRDLNRELVRAGFAWWYRRYARADHMLEKLELEARESMKCSWSRRNHLEGSLFFAHCGFHWREARTSRELFRRSDYGTIGFFYVVPVLWLKME